MTKEEIIASYGTEEFYETAIEEGRIALVCDLNEEGDYAVITDENGEFPLELEQPVIFACYSEEGAFRWSVSFKSSSLLQEIWRHGLPVNEGETNAAASKETSGGLAAVLAYRSSQGYY